MGMSTNVTPKPNSQLWGIYHTNQEHARELGNPLRTVVEAPNKIIAEETAARLGFGDPWAYPVTSEVARHAQWLHKRRKVHRQELAHKSSGGIRI
jgi:hypothetical protein